MNIAMITANALQNVSDEKWGNIATLTAGIKEPEGKVENLDLYLRTKSYVINMFWSDNPPADPDTATAVISSTVYKLNGEEVDGGELDIQDTVFDLKAHAREYLDFIGIEEEYEEITEDEFCDIAT